MTQKPYGMICPITMACEILEPRWTIPILTEIWSGSHRFNDIRRGVGSISTALLSRRLKEMQASGLIERVEDAATGAVEYVRTPMALELEPALNALAVWAQRNINAEIALCSKNLQALMWKMRRSLTVTELPPRRVVMQFRFSDPDLDFNTYWLIAQPDAEVELCTAIPGFDIDLYVETNVKSISSILVARSTVAKEIERGTLFLSGDAQLSKTISRWLPQSEYADVEGIAVA